jgi:mannose PTS system EIID component
MKTIPVGVRRRMLLRSFLVQGSWNYETLIGTGFAFTLIPLLRFLYPNDVAARRAALRRHSSVFNSHPYLAPVAIGAVARLESDGADPAMMERFKSAMRGSLGSLGDRLVWSALRPASLLLAVALLLGGAAWWLAVPAFLLIYNVFHFALRAWGLRVGSESGIEVGKVLRTVPFDAIVSWAGNAGALFAGFALVFAIAPTGRSLELQPIAAGLAAVVAGLWLGLRARRVLVPALGLAWFFVIVWGLIN